MSTAQLSRPSTPSKDPHHGPPDSRTVTERTEILPPSHQRFIFTDTVAFHYLEEDPTTTVLERRRRLEGYELYVVEQWSCSRIHPTFVITTYTGDPSHSVVTNILGVPTDENAWSPRLRIYFKALTQFHARRRETPLGTLMVTDLSDFPSTLTVIAVPEGDLKKHREDFIVNENLKRLGCSGRAGLTIAKPTGATEAKFHQLFKTSDRLPLYSAVIELVRLCQIALVVFDKLGEEYADGLLCDVTEAAIHDWWADIGSEFFSIEPTDGVLGPSTVAALLGLLTGARNRLSAYGAPVSKDVFDIAGLKRGIGYFQKSQRITPRSRRLNLYTLDKLHSATAKAASGEGWAVPKAVKSTVAELSGKGGEMMMGIVGARDKAAIGDVETMDIDQYIELLHGERPKWLWHGKQRKTTATESDTMLGPTPGLIFDRDDQGTGYIWTGRRRDSADFGNYGDSSMYSGGVGSESTTSVDYGGEKDQNLRRNVLKNVTGRMTDAKSGLGRIKDAVGRRSHGSRHYSKEYNGEKYEDPSERHEADVAPSTAPSVSAAPPSPIWPEDSSGDIITTTEPLIREASNHPSGEGSPPPLALRSPTRSASPLSLPSSRGVSRLAAPYTNKKTELTSEGGLATGRLKENEIRQSPSFEEAYETLPTVSRRASQKSFPAQLLRRTHSLAPIDRTRNKAWWPRHLSFGEAEEAVLERGDLAALSPFDTIIKDKVSNEEDNKRNQTSDHNSMDPAVALAIEHSNERHAQLLAIYLSAIASLVTTYVSPSIASLEQLDSQHLHDSELLSAAYHDRMASYSSLQDGARALVDEERSGVDESVRDLETLGARLEYELRGLEAKVEDGEVGVEEMEKLVAGLEGRVEELREEEEGSKKRGGGWGWWVVRVLTGVERRN